MAHIGDHLNTMARQAPSAAALKSAATEITWRAFLDAVHRIETVLVNQTPPGASIAILVSDPAATLQGLFACARTSRIAMVMDGGWPLSRIQQLVQATGPALVIDDAFLQVLPGELDSQAPSGPAPDETDAFYAGFTSGSTGLPKGFVRSHRSWLESFRLSDVDFQATKPNRIIIAGGLSHSLHLYGAVHGLHRGTPVTVMPWFDPRRVLDALRASHGRAALYATPAQLQLIAGAARRPGAGTNAALVFSSGAKWPDGARQAFGDALPEARLVEFYGASETSFISFSRSGDGTPPGSVGKPAEGVHVVIGSPQSPAPPDTAGPVWVKSGLLFSGYLCGGSSETRWQDGWLTFGDHGFLDDRGFLFLTGRESRMVITAGLNVYPEEIEAALMAHPAVGAAVVAGVPDPLRGQRLEAFVDLKPGLQNPAKTLSQHCRALVGAAKTPKRFHVRAGLPMTAGGKPDIQALLQDLVSGHGKDNGLPEPEVPERQMSEREPS